MALISSWSSSRQLAATQVTSYRWAMSERMALARSDAGLAELSSTTKGLPSSFSSEITRSSASK